MYNQGYEARFPEMVLVCRDPEGSVEATCPFMLSPGDYQNFSYYPVDLRATSGEEIVMRPLLGRDRWSRLNGLIRQVEEHQDELFCRNRQWPHNDRFPTYDGWSELSKRYGGVPAEMFEILRCSLVEYQLYQKKRSERFPSYWETRPSDAGVSVLVRHAYLTWEDIIYRKDEYFGSRATIRVPVDLIVHQTVTIDWRIEIHGYGEPCRESKSISVSVTEDVKARLEEMLNPLKELPFVKVCFAHQAEPTAEIAREFFSYLVGLGDIPIQDLPSAESMIKDQ